MYENRHEVRIKIGEGGRMIIPSVYRKAMHIHPGDELVARFQNGELRLFQQKKALERIRASVQQAAVSVGKEKARAGVVKHKISARKVSAMHKDKLQNHVSDFLALRKKDSGE